MRNLYIAFFFIITSLSAFSQNGTITGKVFDLQTGEPLVGAAVIVLNTNLAVATDLDGKYAIRGLKPDEYKLVVKYISYKGDTSNAIKLNAGQVFTYNVKLLKASFVAKQVEIQGKSVNTSIAGMQLMQKNAGGLIEAVSSDQMKLSGDRNTADVLKRTSGITIQEGKYPIVRGLNDRYNIALVNGQILPATEPDRKVFSFDIFPSNMLENLVILKTPQPDYPGEFAGGAITVNTKEGLDSNFLQLGLGSGFNDKITFKSGFSYNGSSTDWLGYDNGLRTLPSNMPGRTKYLTLSENDRFAISKSFNSDWTLNNVSSVSPFTNAVLSFGALMPGKKEEEFAIIGALNYTNTTNLFRQEREDYLPFDSSTNQQQKVSSFRDSVIANDVAVGALLNFSLKIDKNNRILFKNSLNINSDNRTITRTGYRVDQTDFIKAYQYDFRSNRLRTNQLKGEHVLFKNHRMVWMAGVNKLSASQPDLRRLTYTLFDDPSIDSVYSAAIFSQADIQNGGGRFSSQLTETVNNLSLDYSIPFKWKTDDKNQQLFKFGAMYVTKNRTFDARAIGYKIARNSTFNNALLDLPIDSIFRNENIGTTGFVLDDITNPSDQYRASSKTLANYLMLDNKIGTKIRLIWGVRRESFNQNIFTSLPGGDTIDVNKQFNNILPSASFIYKLNEKTNIRLAYAQSVSRPEFREIAPFSFYDFTLFATVSGNPDLKRATIQNYDFRIEHFSGYGQLISFSVFAKTFKDPIEQYFDPRAGVGTFKLITWINSPKATNIGAEINLRKNIFGGKSETKSLMVFAANVAIINSQVEIPLATGGSFKRPLQGQSPFVANMSLQHTVRKIGLTSMLQYNWVGRRIAIVGIPDYNIKDVYENPRPIVDFSLTQTIARKLQVRASINDIINRPIYFYQDQNENGKFELNTIGTKESYLQGNVDNIFQVIRPGRVIQFGITYTF